ncbi:conserved hypothetical protein [Ricinus communis]|uniref:Uncharacterized protein n=1 Tax=Ricinus communis TaxID=3988 RepID=B9SAH4_RICCO|nr:conserved hypothetical protein [Ricinus communis]
MEEDCRESLRWCLDDQKASSRDANHLKKQSPRQIRFQILVIRKPSHWRRIQPGVLPRIWILFQKAKLEASLTKQF